MASFLRHVGKHGDRKVAVVFREIPGEPHMCLVTYTELLNQHIHDPLVQCIESDIGQNSENLADALNRTFTKDGKPILQVLHLEGQLKKVNTEQVIMTPQPNTKIKLSELNNILDEMKKGEEAVKKLAEMDKSMGLQDPKDVVKRMRGPQQPEQTTVTANNGALGDDSIATNLRTQAEKMTREAKGLLAEADRLLKEAEALAPVAVKPSKSVKTTTETKKPRRTKVNAAA